MTTSTILKLAKDQKIGGAPVVVLPLNIWEELKDELEDLEIMKSRFLRKKIAKSRSEKGFYSSSQVKKILDI